MQFKTRLGATPGPKRLSTRTLRWFRDPSIWTGGEDEGEEEEGEKEEEEEEEE